MQILESKNVNDAFKSGLNLINKNGSYEPSRNGSVKVVPFPVLSIIHHPTERVLFNEERDANPFFHLMEAIWMLSGSNKLDFVKQFVARMEEYSDDGKTLAGAYGHRWRKHFKTDQLLETMNMLREDPETRRVVLSMWDANEDLNKVGRKDIPCNTHIYFRRIECSLDMMVCNRSNDIVWGLYGANAVHLTILHEFIAIGLGLKVGVYRHLSNNFHLYPKNVDFKALLNSTDTDLYTPFSNDCVTPLPLYEEPEEASEFLEACEKFIENPINTDSSGFVFIDHTLKPMYEVWVNREDREIAYTLTQKICASDWREGARRWILKRANR